MTRAFPIRWSFQVLSNDTGFRFFRSDTAQVWLRVGYTVDDVRSLIDYLNTRT
jgi:hypothetical protein